MAPRNYWLDLFTGTTWQEFLDSGAAISGFREHRWNSVQKMKRGDYLLCYLTGVMRFIGVLEVTSEAFKSSKPPIWKDEDFPSRVKVKPVVTLTPETGVPVYELRDRLTIFRNLKNPIAWTGYFRGSPYKWKLADGEEVVRAVLAARENPILRPVDPVKLARRPKALRAKMGSVTVPETEEPTERADAAAREPTAHEEIQLLLLELGAGMGFDLWVARNDRSRQVGVKRFTDVPKLRDKLPVKFDEATNRTIELIDVLWLEGNAILAAFEIESTTSVYSGLLRMADLLSMQPNLNIPLYLVAPDDRRDKVIAEVNRPTFSRLRPPLAEVCRYIPFSALRDRLAELKSVVKYLKPDFLEELSESCEIEEV